MEEDKGKGKAMEKQFVWTENLALTLMRVCKDYQRKYGYYQTFTWPDVNEEFEERTGLKVTKNTCRNKIEHMKKLWKPWCDLRRNVTGVGWDSTTNLVTADDEWWERQKKEKDDKYSQFRKKGVNPELSDLWDDVFGQIVATEKHVMSPSMNPSALLLSLPGVDDRVYLGSQEDSLDCQLEKDAEEEQESLRSLAARVSVELPFDECLAQVHEGITVPRSGPSNAREKSSKLAVTPTVSIKKRRRRPSPASTAFNEHMTVVGDASQKLLSMMEGDLGSTNDMAGEVKKYFTYAECVVVLERLVTDGLLKENEKLYCFTASQLAQEPRREVFMSLSKDSNMIAWLQYEYDLAYQLYQP